jgi:hypothetical protein
VDELKKQILPMADANRHRECNQTYPTGDYPNDTARVFCTGNMEIIGFPKVDQLKWSDGVITLDSVNQCRSEPACQKSGLVYLVRDMTVELKPLTSTPFYTQTGNYTNNGSQAADKHFAFKEEEVSTFTLITNGSTNPGITLRTHFILDGFPNEETITMETALGSGPTTNTTKQLWAQESIIQIPAHTTTNYSCSLMRYHYNTTFDIPVDVTGPVLTVISNKEGGGDPVRRMATMLDYLPNGTTYAGNIEGYRGYNVKCSLNETAITAFPPTTAGDTPTSAGPTPTAKPSTSGSLSTSLWLDFFITVISLLLIIT